MLVGNSPLRLIHGKGTGHARARAARVPACASRRLRSVRYGNEEEGSAGVTHRSSFERVPSPGRMSTRRRSSRAFPTSSICSTASNTSKRATTFASGSKLGPPAERQTRHRSDQPRSAPRLHGRARTSSSASPKPGIASRWIIGDFTARIGDPSGKNVDSPAAVARRDRSEHEDVPPTRPAKCSTSSASRCATTPNGSTAEPHRPREAACQDDRRTDARAQRFSRTLRAPARRSRCTSSSIRSRKRTIRSRSTPTSNSAAAINSSTYCSGATTSANTASRRKSARPFRCWSASTDRRR